jgi:hypothetical protein
LSQTEDEDDPEHDDTVIRCWCGAEGTADELFGELDEGCGGTGHVDCHCGGDLCVCHYHGQEQECPGCDECPERDDFDDDSFYDEDD